MNLNCDLAEGAPGDEEIFPLLDYANISCGAHAGDDACINAALKAAKLHQVSVGAHPSYPDRPHFGRRSMTLSDEALKATLKAQLAHLTNLAAQNGITLEYVKPHGALYNDIMASEAKSMQFFKAMSGIQSPKTIMVQANRLSENSKRFADALGFQLIFEAFADRRYLPDGRLVARSEEGAVLTKAEALEQAKALIAKRPITALGGSPLLLQADTLCVHSDTPAAIALCREIYHVLHPKRLI